MSQIFANDSARSELLVRAQQSTDRGDLKGAQKLLLDLIGSGHDVAESERGVQARVQLAEVYEGLSHYDDADDVLAPYDVRNLDNLPTHLRGQLLVAFGSHAYWQDDFPRSVTLLNRAKEILEPTGDVVNLARAYHSLGRAYWALDEIALAREHYELAIEWGRRARKDRSVAISYMNLGLVARQEGDVDEAGMCYRRALRLLRNTTDEVTRARLQTNQGVMQLLQGNFYEAANSLRRALDHLASAPSDHLTGIVYNNLAVISIYTGEWSEAESHIQQALEIARRVEHRLWEGEWTETLGNLRAHQGRTKEANEHLRFALARAKELNSKKDETQALCSLSRLWLMARNTHLALTYARNARELAREIKDERLASEAAILMAEGYRRSDKWMPAEDWAKVAQEELEQLPYPYLDALVQKNIAAFTSRRRDPSRGERLFKQAEEVFRSMNAAYQTAVTVFEHGESLVRRGEHAQAFERFTEAAEQFHKLGAQLDAERSEREAQRASDKTPAWQLAQPASISLVPPDVAPLVMQVLQAASGRERVLRELMFAAKQALGADAAAIFAADDEGQLYAQATIDLDEAGREHASAAIAQHLAKERAAGRSGKEERAFHARAPVADHCHTLAPRRSGGAFVLYLRAPATVSERRAEILEALIGCARLALQMIDLRTDMRRARPFNPLALPDAQNRFQKVIAASFVMRDVLARMERLKDSDATILLLGESGTGKEIIAQSLHEESNRREKIFLPFNCTAAPRELAESQLFGHKKGSFTGAINDQRGIIRAAEGGTLFLDEIGDLPSEIQPKLLRFLQGGEIMPLGENPRKVDVRVIAATNRDLEQDVRQGRFREDLYYRLNTFVIKIPPLRDRTEDIPLLVSYFLEDTCRRNNRQLAGITPEAMGYLARYQWPGNVRQLKSEIERIVVFAEDGQYVGAESLSSDILNSAATPAPVHFNLDFSKQINIKEILIEVERQLLTEALARHNGNVTRAADQLGLRRQTLDYKLRRFHIAHQPGNDEEEG
ncbi:MAG: hypothetical protein AUG51_23865 [Acidobacteria bacterium 13_1_20CM_3_53_8]|nr:MAG: hypothetical protein AUG51_23865 [Acidobacteria bacterium 13_1_20CM_3_53_8]